MAFVARFPGGMPSGREQFKASQRSTRVGCMGSLPSRIKYLITSRSVSSRWDSSRGGRSVELVRVKDSSLTREGVLAVVLPALYDEGVVILGSMVRGVTLFWLSASHASRGMASGTWPKPGRGARWVILAIHTLTGYLLRFKRASRSTQGPRTCDSSKLHPRQAVTIGPHCPRARC